MIRLSSSILIAFLLLVLALPSPGRAEENVTVRVYGLPQISSASAQDIATTRVVQEFRRLHPNITLLPANGLRIEGLGDEMGPLMMIAGGIAPDVLYVNFRKIDRYVREGFLYPLDEFIAAEQKKNPDWLANRILPQVQDVVWRPGPDGAKHCYALPGQYLVMGLYFNKPLFRQAGLPQRVPKDWEELIEFSRKINEMDRRNRGLVLYSGQQASWNLMNFLWSAGGEAVQEIAPNDWRAVFDTEEAVDAFSYYYRITEGDRVAFRENVSDLFRTSESRRVGMVFSYIGTTVSLDPNVWSFGAVPVGPTGKRGAEINSEMMGIFAGVKDPAVREAAWKFISFFASPEAQRIRTQTLVELGMINQINPADLRRFGYTNLLAFSPPGLEEEFQLALSTGRPEPYGRNCDLVYLEMTYPLDQILLSPLLAQAWKSGNHTAFRDEVRRILKNGVQVTNERMIGLVPEKKMQTRRIVASVVVAIIVLAFILAGRAIFRSFSHAGGGTTRSRSAYTGWALLAVPLLLAAVWYYIPLARGAWMSLLDYQLLKPSVFVGIDNFANILFDKRFWTSMLATLHFSFWMLTAGFVTPIVLAYMLHITPRHTVLFRVIYYLPALLTGTAVFVLWKEFFGASGMVNEFLSNLGLNITRAWPEDPSLAMLSCVLPGIWAGAGPGCLIYLAALKTIPEEQFEASEIDGAGLYHKTIHIVVPALMPLVLINFIGAVMAAFQASQNILIMTAGGPNGMTEVAALRIFYEAFLFLHFGPATAMAWILGSLLVGFALLQLQRLSRMEFKSGRK
jgi:ABC-type sugar transport system permease subunit/ABC-type glycerol-3-phosphate transport system substrate-binding protein